MNVYVVSRHPGAIEWVRQTVVALNPQLPDHRIHIVQHLEDLSVAPGDWVCGVMPMCWAARLCEQGAVVALLEMPLPAHLRGVELSAQDMQTYGARLVRYQVQKLEALA